MKPKNYAETINAYAKIGLASIVGFQFKDFVKAPSKDGQHSVWVKTPNSDNWVCHKANGSRTDWVDALLQASGISQHMRDAAEQMA